MVPTVVPDVGVTIPTVFPGVGVTFPCVPWPALFDTVPMP